MLNRGGYIASGSKATLGLRNQNCYLTSMIAVSKNGLPRTEMQANKWFKSDAIQRARLQRLRIFASGKPAVLRRLTKRYVYEAGGQW